MKHAQESGTCVHQTDDRVLLFDGVCNLCQWSVRFVMARDAKRRFRFASLQSRYGQQWLATHGAVGDAGAGHVNFEQTVVFVMKGQSYTRSTAVLKVCRELNGWWPGLYVLMGIPQPIRDSLYDWIAKHRYQWFGKRAVCMIPTEDNQSRFLD